MAIAQVFMGLPNDRQLLALAAYRLGHLFPYMPRQSGYNKRKRKLVPEISHSWERERRDFEPAASGVTGR